MRSEVYLIGAVLISFAGMIVGCQGTAEIAPGERAAVASSPYAGETDQRDQFLRGYREGYARARDHDARRDKEFIVVTSQGDAYSEGTLAGVTAGRRDRSRIDDIDPKFEEGFDPFAAPQSR